MLFAIFLGVNTLSAQNCQADFQYWTSGLTAQFMDSTFSSSGNHSYDWDFGDGGSSTLSNPGHTYNQAGTYSVRLLIQDSLCFDSIVKLVTVLNPISCQADFFFNNNNALRVDYVNNSTAVGGGLYQWDFGDGFFSNSNSRSVIPHTYGQAGTYNVCLMVVDTFSNCSDSICKSVVVSSTKSCKADFTYVAVQNGVYNFQNLSTPLSSLLFAWDFGDGIIDTSNTINPSHTYSSPGTYRVVLYTWDTNRQCGDSISKLINYSQPCQAGFTYQVNCNQVQFTNTASNYTELVYSFGDGDSSSLPHPTHTYTQSGSYIVCQKVTDSLTNCTATFCDTIQVTLPQPCQAGFTYSMMGDSVLFRSTANNYTRLTYYFGDGDTSNLDNPIHVYASSNQYTVTQIVYNDSTNCTDTIVKTLWATNSGTCVAKYQIAIDTTIKTTLFLINQSTNQSTHRYDWDFGDGTFGTGRIPTHQYTDNIAYKICLTVSDSSLNCISTYCDSVGLDTTGNILKSRGFLLKVLNGGTIGVEEEDLNQLISVYPNPVQSQLTIESNQSEQLNYQLYGIDGVAYKSGVISMETIQLSLSELSKGMYFLRLTDGKQLVTKKIIKQ